MTLCCCGIVVGMSTITSYVLLSALVQIFLASTLAKEIRWDLMHQNDYDIIPHRVEVKWYNQSYGHIERLAFVKYNRTYRRTINASATLYKEIRKDFKASVQLYKFLSNTYKFFPVTVTIVVCEEYERNSINIQTILKSYSNVNSCPPKPGYWYVTYLDVDFSRFPPFIPRGDYRMDIEIVSGADKLGFLEAYGSVVAAPKKN